MENYKQLEFEFPIDQMTAGYLIYLASMVQEGHMDYEQAQMRVQSYGYSEDLFDKAIIAYERNREE